MPALDWQNYRTRKARPTALGSPFHSFDSRNEFQIVLPARAAGKWSDSMASETSSSLLLLAWVIPKCTQRVRLDRRDHYVWQLWPLDAQCETEMRAATGSVVL